MAMAGSARDEISHSSSSSDSSVPYLPYHDVEILMTDALHQYAENRNCHEYSSMLALLESPHHVHPETLSHMFSFLTNATARLDLREHQSLFRVALQVGWGFEERIVPPDCSEYFPREGARMVDPHRHRALLEAFRSQYESDSLDPSKLWIAMVPNMDRFRNIAPAFATMALSLVSFYGSPLLSQLLRNILRALDRTVPFEALSASNDNSSAFLEVGDYFLVLFQRSLFLAPTVVKDIPRMIQESFPVLRVPANVTTTFVSNMLRLATLLPQLHRLILSACVEHIIPLDVQIGFDPSFSIVLDQANLSETVAQNQAVLKQSLVGGAEWQRTISVLQQRSLLQHVFLDQIDPSYIAEIDEACREIDVIADQVDYLMITIFEFIRSVAVASLPRESIHSIFCEPPEGLNLKKYAPSFRFDPPNLSRDLQSVFGSGDDRDASKQELHVLRRSASSSGLFSSSGNSETEESSEITFDSVYASLQDVFHRCILPTHRSKCAQFILFYCCSISERCMDHFLGFLIDCFVNPSSPPVLRQSAVSYLGSFVARSRVMSVDVTRQIVALFAEHIVAYIEDQDTCISENEIDNHSLFFWLCQTLFYIICFKHMYLFDESVHLEESSRVFGEASSSDKPLFHDLQLQRIVDARLNPLKVVLESVVREFSRITAHYKWCDCSHRISLNQSSFSNDLRSPSKRKKSTLRAELDSFFPFDPFLLRLSSTYVEPLYQVWEAVYFDEKDDDVLGDDDMFLAVQDSTGQYEDGLGYDSDDHGSLDDSPPPSPNIPRYPGVSSRPQYHATFVRRPSPSDLSDPLNESSSSIEHHHRRRHEQSPSSASDSTSSSLTNSGLREISMLQRDSKHQFSVTRNGPGLGTLGGSNIASSFMSVDSQGSPSMSYLISQHQSSKAVSYSTNRESHQSIVSGMSPLRPIGPSFFDGYSPGSRIFASPDSSVQRMGSNELNSFGPFGAGPNFYSPSLGPQRSPFASGSGSRNGSNRSPPSDDFRL